MSTRPDRVRIVAVALLLIICSPPLSPQDRVLLDHAGAANGVTGSGDYRVQASIGIAVVGLSSGSGYHARAGFQVAISSLNDRLFADGIEN